MINTVYFEKGSNFANVYNLYQWDYGQGLEIKGLDIHNNVWVQFSMNASGGNAIPVVTEVNDGVITANIPAFVFEKETSQNYNAYAFVYVSNADSGETVKVIKLNIKARPKPEDYVYTEPEKQRYEILENLIKSFLNSNGEIDPKKIPDMYYKEDGLVNTIKEEYLGLDWVPKIRVNNVEIFKEQEITVTNQNSLGNGKLYLYDLNIDQETRKRIVDEFESLTLVLDGNKIELPYVERLEEDGYVYEAIFTINPFNQQGTSYEGTVLVGAGKNATMQVVLTLGEHTLEVRHINVTPNPLPAEFLTDGTPYLEKTFSEILPEMTGTTSDLYGGQINLPKGLELFEGDEYNVKWQGKEYDCKCFSIEIDGVKINVLGDAYTLSGGEVGKEATGEPFCFFIYPKELQEMINASSLCTPVPHVSNETFTFSIDGYKKKLRKLPEECLPDSIKDLLNGSLPSIKVDSELSKTSTNPVQNKVVAKAVEKLSEEIVDQETLVNNKTDKYVTPEQFGAKCDNGWSDDTKAVQDCLDYAEKNNLAVRGIGVYHIYSPITITGKYQDIFLKQITYYGTDYAVTIKTQFSSVSINLVYAPNGFGVNCVSDESIACIYNKFNFSNVLTSDTCIYVGNIDGEIQSVVSYNSFSTCWLKSAMGNCIKAINLAGGENSFNGNSSGLDSPNDYAFYFKKGATINVDKFAVENGCKSGFYVEDTKVVAGYIRTRECMDTKRIDSGDKGLMLKLVGMAHFYSDFTHIDVTCIDISELDHVFNDPNHLIYDEESICYVKAGRYCSSFYYGDLRKAYDIPGYIRMTGPYMFLDYEGRQIYHDFTENLDLRNWGILPPNILDIHADGYFILNNAYCANGISVININQTYGNFVTIKDKNENVIFDGAEYGFGTYQLQCFISKASHDIHEWLYNPDFDTWKVVQTSKKEDEWELIETITIEEDDVTNIARTEEPDGTPYNFKNIYVCVSVPTKSTESGNVNIYIGDGANKWRGEITLKNFFSKSYDNIKLWGTYLKNNNLLIPISLEGSPWSPTLIYSNPHKLKSSFIMKSIMFSAIPSSMLYPIGTTFEIYAIRA